MLSKVKCSLSIVPQKDRHRPCQLRATRISLLLLAVSSLLAALFDVDVALEPVNSDGEFYTLTVKPFKEDHFLLLPTYYTSELTNERD